MSGSKNNTEQLALRIATFIIKQGGTTYRTIRESAFEKGIDMADLEEAFTLLHKNPMVHRTMVAGDVKYVIRPVVEKKVTPSTHLAWVREHYPPMTSDNNGSGIDLDLSWMFLKTAEERDAYKAAVRGVSYIKREVYEQT